ncbi:MAG: excisionase family DNA-binding protein [Thermomicrobiales bacterium]
MKDGLTEVTMQNEFMTIRQAAEALGVTRVTVWRRVKEGDLEAFQSQADRRERLVRRSDVEALMRPVPIAEGSDTKKLVA